MSWSYRTLSPKLPTSAAYPTLSWNDAIRDTLCSGCSGVPMTRSVLSDSLDGLDQRVSDAPSARATTWKVPDEAL